jgi:DNA polymerase III epsilon subunit-like protein
MEKRYVSFDVEASGRSPGKYSMLSIGACIVGDTSIQFYRELKPLNDNYILDAMRVGCLGLRCLDDLKHIPSYDPRSSGFEPKKVLEVLAAKGEDPREVMAEYASWVVENTREYLPIEAAAPTKFDGMYSAWYFDNFYAGKNPLGHSAEDISSMYRGITKNVNASLKDLVMRAEHGLSHNALDDAIRQAKEFEYVLSLMRA